MSNLSGNRAQAALTFVFIAAATAWGMYQLSPPRVLPADAPANEFSGMRALAHLRAYARQPHPFGSAAQDAVRQYIVGRLTALGVTPDVYTAPVSRDTRGGFPVATGIVHDIIARVPGTANSKPLVLMGHYDSVPGGPGAADDGGGVSVLLETLRALRTGPPLRNDLIFLFTDGEEAGLLGAKAFADAHAPEIGLALDFESRGSSGPGMMFSTSKGNGWMVRQMASAAPYPVANSLSYEVYRLLPNETDLGTFKDAGIPCMDFAFIGDITYYHTALDDPDHIDPRSLQHQGSYALSLARHFGNLDLSHVTDSDVTYFNFPLLRVVIYPISWSLPLAVILTVLSVAVAGFGLARRRLTAGGLLGGAVAFLVTLAVAAYAPMGLWKLILKWYPGYNQMLQGDPYHAWVYRMACTALVIAVFTTFYNWFRRRTSIANLLAGAVVTWLALATATAIYLPGASYVFTWPPMFAIGALAFLILRREKDASWSGVLILWAFALPAIVMMAPMVDQMFVAMTMMLSAAAALFAILLLGLLIPLLDLMGKRSKWWLPGGALLVCALCVMAGSAMSGFSHEYPKPDSLFYGLDADTGKAFWFSGDRQPDSWTFAAMGSNPQHPTKTEFMPFLTWPLWVNEGHAAPFPAPIVERLEDNTADGVRTLRLHIVSPRKATEIFVYPDPQVQLVSATVNGKSVGPDIRHHDSKPGLKMLDAIRFGQWSFDYEGAPAEGFELDMKMKAGPLRITVIDQSYGLAGTGAPDRPADTISLPWMPDSVFVRKSYHF